ncbi:hypothetical protein KFE25_007460 [Diacronema lutheri]|uniref:Uncharacterized protein n=1 Tax=Diacronema lutheri TaxID=2081491 RepID=A0A8J5XUU9_DIALT|nr:hypothetical protein KFE25_007460 [Diacronema lutheri]
MAPAQTRREALLEEVGADLLETLAAALQAKRGAFTRTAAANTSETACGAPPAERARGDEQRARQERVPRGAADAGAPAGVSSAELARRAVSPVGLTYRTPWTSRAHRRCDAHPDGGRASPFVAWAASRASPGAGADGTPRFMRPLTRPRAQNRATSFAAAALSPTLRWQSAPAAATAVPLDLRSPLGSNGRADSPDGEGARGRFQPGEMIVREARWQLRARRRRRHLRAWRAATRAARAARARARDRAAHVLHGWAAMNCGWQLETAARELLAELAEARGGLARALRRLVDWARAARARRAWRLRELCAAPAPRGPFALAGMRWLGDVAKSARTDGGAPASARGSTAESSLRALRRAAARAAGLHEFGRVAWRAWRDVAAASAAHVHARLAAARSPARARMRGAFRQLLGAAASGAQRELAAAARRRLALRHGRAALAARAARAACQSAAPAAADVARRWGLRRWAAAPAHDVALSAAGVVALAARAAARELSRFARAARARLRARGLTRVATAAWRARARRWAALQWRRDVDQRLAFYAARDAFRWRAASRALAVLLRGARTRLGAQMLHVEAAGAAAALARRAALARWRSTRATGGKRSDGQSATHRMRLGALWPEDGGASPKGDFCDTCALASASARGSEATLRWSSPTDVRSPAASARSRRSARQSDVASPGFSDQF